MEFSNPKPPINQQGSGGMSSNSRIPDELCHEILLRLPVKSVLKCKCVCKSWCSMISNPSFSKFHQQLNKNNNSSGRLLLGLGNDRSGELMHSIGFDSLESSTEIEQDSAIRMQYPFKLDMKYVRLLGSCNGLVFLSLYDSESDEDCLTNIDSDSFTDDDDDNNGGGGEDSQSNDGYFSSDGDYDDGDYDYEDDFEVDDDDIGGAKDFFCVWNPATGEFKKLTQSLNPFYHMYMYGLGYDGKNDDYKLVIGERRLDTSVKVYSLRSNLWEIIKTSYDFMYDEQKSGVLVNEDLHWLALGKCGVCIIYLDFSNDTPLFKEIQLPKITFLRFISIAVLANGCLCLLGDNCDLPAGFDSVEVWEMQIYGVPESWTKLYVIYNETISRPVWDKEFLKIIWSFKNGNIVLLNSSNVVVYDPKDESAIERSLNRFANFTSEVNYVESLVSLNSGTYVGTEQLEESTEDKA